MTTTIEVTQAEAARIIRQREHYTLADAAEHAGVSPSTIIRREARATGKPQKMELEPYEISKLLRERLGWSRSQAAEELGLHPWLYGQLERRGDPMLINSLKRKANIILTKRV